MTTEATASSHRQHPDADAPGSPPAEPRTRRAFVFFGALAAAAFAPRAARAQRIVPRRPASTPRDRFATIHPQESAAAPEAWSSSVVRLVRRATLGLTDTEVALAQRLGYQGYLNRQIRYTRLDNGATESFVAAKWPLLAQPISGIYRTETSQVLTQLQEATIYRAAFSPRQLYERMVEFWSDHFNISVNKVGALKIIDDRDVIRKNAMGSFFTLLRASAHSPAMLAYLDQTASHAGAPNQNYARELMELHTLGVDGGYTQDDVAEMSRVLTGWTIQGQGTFTFNPFLHDWGSKTVLGVTIPAGSASLGADGIKEGEQMLDVLLRHPSTARFIATKMLRWLLTPTPSESQIRAVVSVYRSTNGDIPSMVRAILNDTWLTTAPMKLKRPFHYLVSALRATNPTVTSVTSMNGQLNAIGQPLFVWETPDGYPDKVEYWAGNILPRWSFAATLAGTNTSTLAVDVRPLMVGNTADATIDAIDARVFGGEMPTSTRAALTSYLKGGTYGDGRVRETLGLALGSLDFQWY